MKAVITIGLLLITCSTFAQVKHDYNWALGHDSNLVDSTFGGTDINFNTNPISLSYVFRDMNIEPTNTTMSDAEGNLIFYSNGCKIFNADHELMENGDNINPGQVHDIQCDDAYTVLQGMISLPAPGHDSLYYIFHQHLIYLTNPFDVQIDQLLCTTIDMTLDSGKGAVTLKNEPVINSILAFGQFSAVKHANGNDWWILAPGDTSNLYYSIQITSDTITEPSVQAIGLPFSYSGGGSGQDLFSPDGTKYARYNQTDQVYLFDFDRSTGQLSEFQQLTVADTAYSGGIAFSPNSRYLYISSTFHVYQFDTWAADIQASKIIVATYDGFEDPFPTVFQLMQMGPDCRIYINSGSSHRSFHVINQPDEAGLACDLQQHSFHLPTDNFRAMPHFPNYRLGTTPTYPCDPSIEFPDFPTAVSELEEAGVEFSLYPNPTSGVLRLELPEEVQSITITNALGMVMRRWSAGGFLREWVVEDLDLVEGIYYCTVKTEEGDLTRAFVVIR